MISDNELNILVKRLKLEHIEDLHKSCIPDEYVYKEGIHSTVIQIGDQKHSGYQIEYWNPITSSFIHSRYRLDNPVKHKNGRLAKYHQKGGSKVQPFFSQTKSHSQWQKDLADINIPRFLVEGEKKSLCIMANIGTPANVVGLSGVYGWSQGDKQLNEILAQYVVIPQSPVTVVVDSDYNTVPNVKLAILALCQKLLDCRCKAFLLVTPSDPNNASNKLGIDDWLYRYKEEERTLELNKLLERKIRISREYIKRELPIARKALKVHGSKDLYDTYGGEPEVKSFSDLLVDKYKIHTYYHLGEEIVSLFNGKIWEPLPSRKAKQMLREEFRLEGKPEKVSSVLEDLKSETFRDDLVWRQIEQHQIPLKDYIFDCKDIKLIDYSYEHMLKSKVEYNYELNAQTPVWDKVLSDWFSVDGQLDQARVDLLHEIIGYCMTQRNLLKKAFVCLGEKNSGKSLFGRVLTEILGESNVSCTKLHNLSKDFGLASLPDKLLNIDDEPIIDKKYKVDEATFKFLISPENMIEVNMKNRAQSSIRLFCKFLILANTLPPIEDKAALDRLIILRFDNSLPFEKQDPALIDKLRPEYDGIVSKAADAYARLAQRGNKFTCPESSQEALDDYEKQSNRLSYWFEQLVEETGSIEDLYTKEQWYETYSNTRFEPRFKDIGLPPLTKRNLIKALEGLGVEFKNRHVPKDGKTHSCSVGYCFKNLH